MSWYISETWEGDEKTRELSAIHLVNFVCGKYIRILIKRNARRIEITAYDISSIDYNYENDTIIISDFYGDRHMIKKNGLFNLKKLIETDIGKGRFYGAIKQVLEELVPMIW